MATELKDSLSHGVNTKHDGQPNGRAELSEPLIGSIPTEGVPEDASNQQLNGLTDDLLKFEVPFTELPRNVLITAYKTIIRENLGIFPSIIGIPLINAGGMISINQSNRPDVQATFGLFNSYMIMFTIAVELSLMDKLGIDLSTSFGAKDYAGCRKQLTKGLLVNSIMCFLVCIPINMFAGPILLAADISEDNAAGVQQMTSIFAWIVPLMFASEMLKTFCMAQGLEHYFGKIGMVNNTLNIIFNYIMIVHYGYGGEVIVIGRGIFSGADLLLGYYVVLQTEPETRGLVSLTEALEGFGAYFFESLSYVFGTYSEFIGFEIATYFVALRHNNNMISAYSAVISLAGIVYCTGMAFAIICRTRINILIGMKQFRVAANYFEFFVKSAAGTGVAVGVVSAVLTPWIAASFASSNDEMYWHFVLVFLTYCVFMASETSVYCSFVGMKTVGKVRTLVKLNCIWIVGANFLGCLLAFWLTDGPGWIFLSVMVCLMVLNYICYKTTMESDWSVAKTEEGGAEPEEKELKEIGAQ